MRIEEDIKLDYADVLFRPKRSTLSSRKDVELKRIYNFKYSNHQWSGIPIIAANMDGVGELEIAKNQYLGNLSINLQTAHDYALYYGMNYLLTKEVLTIHQITKIINDINLDDILNVSKEIFKNERLNMVIIGPYDDNEQKKIAKSLKI